MNWPGLAFRAIRGASTVSWQTVPFAISFFARIGCNGPTPFEDVKFLTNKT
jgi:hypothetical protein